LFTAEWCPFCRRFTPVFESAVKEKEIPWAYVDVSDLMNPLWDTFDIQVVPTIIVFRDGNAAFRKDGILGRGLSAQDVEEATQHAKNGQVRTKS